MVGISGSGVGQGNREGHGLFLSMYPHCSINKAKNIRNCRMSGESYGMSGKTCFITFMAHVLSFSTKTKTIIFAFE